MSAQDETMKALGAIIDSAKSLDDPRLSALLAELKTAQRKVQEIMRNRLGWRGRGDAR
jgi:hypothetical protein